MRLHPLKLVFVALTALAIAPLHAVHAAEGFRLSAPEALVKTGFLKHLLPRFSLKTGTRIEAVAEGESADASFAQDEEGRAVFSGPSGLWKMQTLTSDHDGVVQFSDWLISDVGQRTITAFAVDGENLFSLPSQEQAAVVEVSFEGDAATGAQLSVLHCGRCHTVNEATRFSALGSTPSFAVLRAMQDWDLRFQSFYLLNPHPAFTQIADVTDPFPIDRPSPIIPLELTIAEFEAILAYVSAVPPADLGAPLKHQ
ncbi:hypothetical protein ROA7450_00701 [Roseovarius albus]|uniref:Cytochrome c domain-containing protein n=1 Tax=Roseovarius albus TaxID=1247867 RepID=A0A1X6YG16_9RHOB|nr:hypothetical protein [Roseovarius albus]SLN20561.1 hypothetical protein ROA7450_00701 [Roseovarius albus]